MQENVKIVPSLATSFTVYAIPDVTVKPDGTGNVRVHDPWTDMEYGFGEAQLLPEVRSEVFFQP